mgnify:CR=1 FL=1
MVSSAAAASAKMDLNMVDANTGKTISALAPAFNPERFTDPAKSEKWFRRNCNDVLARECTAAEKADMLAWLVSLKR